MKIVFAPDSFKESLTAFEVGKSMEKGFKKVFKDMESLIIPMADGGEGTMESLVYAKNGVIERFRVKSLVGKNIYCPIGIIDNGKTIVIDSSSSLGLDLAKEEKRNLMDTTSYGLGELVRCSLDLEPSNIIIGLGGSGTNDGGIGMFMALGGKLLDKNGNDIGLGGKELSKIRNIDFKNLDKRLKEVNLIGAYDVENPLTGEDGATKVYGPQKGANQDMVNILESGMANYKNILDNILKEDINKIKGTGSAGGLGAGILVLLDGKLKSGIDVVLEYSDFKNRIKGSDLIITGEGRLDYQTNFGKTPLGVAKTAKKEGISVIGISGALDIDNESAYSMGFDSVFSIIPGVISLPKALKDGKVNIESVSENIARILSMNFK